MQQLSRVVMAMWIAACGGSSSSATPDGSPGDALPGDGLDPDAAPPAPAVIAMGEVRPSSLAVFAGNVYWATDPITADGQIRKATPGGSPTTLAAAEKAPTGIAVGQGLIEPTVFWCTNTLLGQIRQIATTGAPPIGGADVSDAAYALVLDGDAVFAGTRGAVLKKGLGNVASPTTLASGYANGVTALAADAGGVVFGARTTTGSWIVASVGRAGGTVTTLTTGTNVIRDIALVGSTAYWLEANTIRSVPRAGGAPTVVKTLDDVPWALVATGGKLYIATNQGVINPSGATGRILELDPSSSAVRELAKAQAEPADVAVDATHVYWANRGLAANQGQILRIAR